MINETVQLIEKRRSCRSFLDKPIAKETLDELKRLTLRAPSGGNMNMYSIIEITDQKKKDEMAVLCDNQIMISKAPGVWVFLADIERWYNWIKDGGSEERIKKTVRKPGIGDFHLAMQDAIVASQNAVIAAEALGLASCYIGDVIENYEKMQKLLNLPQYACPASMIIFGYPKSYGSAKQTERPEPKYLFMENSYKNYTPEECELMYSKHKAELSERKVLPNNNTGTFADYYFNRKYSSAFMDEMNRSASVFISRWTDGEE